MCEATTALLALSIGLQVVGGIGSAQSSLQQGYDQKHYYYYMADVNDRQASAVEGSARKAVTYAQDTAARQSKQLSDAVKSVEGTQAAAMAANGVGGGSATAEDVAVDTMNKSMLDQLAIRYSADMESSKIVDDAKIQADDLRSTARLNRMSGDNALRSGQTNALTSIIGSAGNVASSWYGYKNKKTRG
jgi:hypothetical protein